MIPPPMSERRQRTLEATTALVVAALFAFHVWNFYFLGDDAFIIFRYADQLVRGHGLTWNPGEWVEGYSSFLWTILMAVSLRLGVAPELSSNALGILCGAAVLAIAHSLARKPGGLGLFGTYLFVGSLAASRSFAAWCTGGLETMAFTLLVFAGLARFLAEREREHARPWSGLLLALACLTRPEGPLFALGAGLVLLVDVARGKCRPVRVVAWGAPVVLLVGAHVLWRHAAYGYWLPNTFYAKVGGAWLEQSLAYLSLFHEDYRFGWFLPLAAVAVAVRRDARSLLFGGLLAAYLGYVLYIGGDRFEFRFLVVVLPMAAWLVVDGIRFVARGAGALAGKGAGRAAAGLLGVLFFASTLHGSWRPEARETRHDVASIDAIEAYAAHRIQQGKRVRRLIDSGAVPADLLICVASAGALPYYSRLPVVDVRGLNDEFVAHMPITERTKIAHEHAAPMSYLKQRDVIAFVFRSFVVDRLDRSVRVGDSWEGEPLQPRAVKLGDEVLVFGSLVSDRRLRAIFPGAEVIDLEAELGPRRRSF